MDEREYTHGEMRDDIARLEAELGVGEDQPQPGVREELRRVISAPKGSEVAKARRTLGWMLVVFGLIGVPALIALIVIVAAVIGG